MGGSLGIENLRGLTPPPCGLKIISRDGEFLRSFNKKMWLPNPIPLMSSMNLVNPHLAG